MAFGHILDNLSLRYGNLRKTFLFVIVFYKNSLQIINFKITCFKITTYAKTPMK